MASNDKMSKFLTVENLNKLDPLVSKEDVVKHLNDNIDNMKKQMDHILKDNPIKDVHNTKNLPPSIIYDQKIKDDIEKIKKEKFDVFLQDINEKHINASLQDGKMIPSEGMDDANREAAKVYNEQGMQAFFEHISTGENGERLPYWKMREKYG